MILLIAGPTHTGKTYTAQKLLEKFKFPYLSIDHLKMGLIRSGQTELTPYDDKELTDYLWSIVKEIIKTAVENKQNLIVEGCYIPYDWERYFDDNYLQYIRCCFLVMSERYVRSAYDKIVQYANVVENRICQDETKNKLVADNIEALTNCEKFGCRYCLIDGEYPTVEKITEILKIK